VSTSDTTNAAAPAALGPSIQGYAEKFVTIGGSEHWIRNEAWLWQFQWTFFVIASGL